MEVPTSTELIEKAKKRFEELERKEYEWNSFFNGFIEGYCTALEDDV